MDAAFSGASTGVTTSGTITQLAAGHSNATGLKVGLNTAVAGAISGTATLALTSDGSGIDGLAAGKLAAQTVDVTGAVYNDATASLAGTVVNLGVVHVGDTISRALTLTNAGALGAYTENLDASFTGASGGITASGAITGLTAGGTDSTDLQLGIATTTAGTISGSAVLALKSDGSGIDGLGTTALANDTIGVTGIVDTYAVAAFDDPTAPAISGSGTSYVLNLGTVTQGGAALTATLGAENAATGLSDLLGGTISTAGGTGFTNGGFGAFSGLGAGQSETLQTLSLATSAVGTFSETVLLSATGNNASGYAGVLPTETLTVTGTVTAAAPTIYAVGDLPVTIAGANGGDLFTATGGALNSRDSLTGGTGTNVLQLTGGGVFDIGAPKTFSAIPTITAYEAQAPLPGGADNRQTVLLRNGAAETVNVVSGTPAAGNSNPETITIYGGTGADVISLGTGSDLVVLGGSSETVHGGGGVALVQGTAAMAGAKVIGTAAGQTTFELTTGGTVTLNGSDTELTVQLDAATVLTTGKLAFITVNGGNGGDTITADGGSQTLIGGTGDVLNGYSSGGDTFMGASAALNGDTIGKWATGDVIDLTDLNSATLMPLSFANGTTAGTLTVSDGTHTAALNFSTTSLALHNFTVAGSDGHGGTLIDWHS